MFVIGLKRGGSSAVAEADGGGARSSSFYDDRDDGRLSALPEAAVVTDGLVLHDDAGFGMQVVELSAARILELGGTALKDPNPLKRRAAFDELLKGMTAENALEIREQIKNLPQDSSEFRDFHYAWGAVAGGDAVLHGMESKERDMEVTLAGWAGADAAGALAWFSGLSKEEGAQNGQLKAGLVHGLADTDPAAAANFVFELNAKGDRQAEELLSIVTGEMLRSVGAEEASVWAENLPDGALRASAMDRVANRLVKENPEAAAAWAERFAGDPGSARVIEEVGDEWAERDPVAAVGWLETLDSGEGKRWAMSSAFGEWVKRDPLAASQRLVTMGDSPERDSAISGFAGRLAWEDPQSAIAWAGEISDPGERERTLVRAGQAMLRSDAEGTRQWLQTSGLSAAAQKQVLNPPSRRRR
ncbi:MAG: hypothetical protein ACI9UA_002182 [Pseudoalteromonas tetraodonis]|jgi:hypothetical protein